MCPAGLAATHKAVVTHEQVPGHGPNNCLWRMPQLMLWEGKAAVVLAVAGILVWAVWRSPHRGDLSTFGGFVVAVIAPVASLIVYLTKLRRPGDAGPGRPLSELADSLAAAVREQWRQAALERRLLQPEPIPVRWVRSARPLAGPLSAAIGSRQFPPLPGLPAAAAGRVRSGQLQDLHAVHGGLGSGRLVIIGGPGSPRWAGRAP
jgi:hypothetical protein